MANVRGWLFKYANGTEHFTSSVTDALHLMTRMDAARDTVVEMFEGSSGLPPAIATQVEAWKTNRNNGTKVISHELWLRCPEYRNDYNIPLGRIDLSNEGDNHG